MRHKRNVRKSRGVAILGYATAACRLVFAEFDMLVYVAYERVIVIVFAYEVFYVFDSTRRVIKVEFKIDRFFGTAYIESYGKSFYLTAVFNVGRTTCRADNARNR